MNFNLFSFRNFRVFTYFLIVNTFIACTNEVKVENTNTPKENQKKLPFEQRFKREIESKLQIPVNEKYTYKIYKDFLNLDDVKDAVITVNRLQFAMNEAAKSENTAQRAEAGYTGNYNFFFFYDGKTDQISNPIAVASSPQVPLDLKLENIQSEFFKDITVTYHIRNSAFKNYYLMSNGNIQLMFQWKLFDAIGTATPEANFLEYEKGSYNEFKDIVIYKGKIKNYSPVVKDIYNYNPVIEKDGAKLYRFFFDKRTMKYSTND
jgi:hypothetical protein